MAQPNSHSRVPEERIRLVNGHAPRPGDYILYWMIAARRAHANFALQRAVELARDHRVPVVVFEPVRCDYPFASERLHRFLLDGMVDNHTALRAAVVYYPYVEPAHGAGRGLLLALAERAAIVVTDDYPAFFLPQMITAAGAKLNVRLEAVDSNGLLPMRLPGRPFTTAYAFRRYLQKTLPRYLAQTPQVDPVAGLQAADSTVPAAIYRRWPAATRELLVGDAAAIAALPIDHRVAVVPDAHGGAQRAKVLLRRFVEERLPQYDQRNHPDVPVASELSPYLHFGHIGAHEVFAAISKAEGWTSARLTAKATGGRSGWWRMQAPAEQFLDQLVTWRELGFNSCVFQQPNTTLESLPAWALATLKQHQHDEREVVYTPHQLEQAATHDPVWNAAQIELVRSGRIHNYLRMLWGKKILEWSSSPELALQTMLELNDRYALDGRDPNSLSGIFWVLGRYDRAWGPERAVFGKVRYMSSANTARKLRLREYLKRHGGNSER